MTKILLQTTIPYAADDWHVGRYSLLRDVLAAMDGVDVTARDREPVNGIDPVLASLGESDFDQLWLFGADGGNGLSPDECAAITAFVRRGGAILATRDHDDCGASICTIGGVGATHFFHSRNLDPDPSRRQRDDQETTSIDWPNYHSGSNGDSQRISIEGDVHPLLRREDGSAIEWFPAHPHEGAVGVPPGETAARVIATGRSQTTDRTFNLVVALDATPNRGRAISHSSFHHFCDYNWDTAAGCPSFVAEPPGDELRRYPERLHDIRTYVRNAATWLSERRRLDG